MATPFNPYVAGNPVGDSPAFVGRADVLREVMRVLRRLPMLHHLPHRQRPERDREVFRGWLWGFSVWRSAWKRA